tara:strand:- start:249 stop:419 length:171 start_codon:yes stop_codon:yes gene_type:complete
MVQDVLEHIKVLLVRHTHTVDGVDLVVYHNNGEPSLVSDLVQVEVEVMVYLDLLGQ